MPVVLPTTGWAQSPSPEQLGDRDGRINALCLAAYRAGLFVTTLIVGATGFFGGALVYGINHYAL